MRQTNRQLTKELIAEVKGLRRDLKGLSVVTVRELSAAVKAELGGAVNRAVRR